MPLKHILSYKCCDLLSSTAAFCSYSCRWSFSVEGRAPAPWTASLPSGGRQAALSVPVPDLLPTVLFLLRLWSGKSSAIHKIILYGICIFYYYHIFISPPAPPFDALLCYPGSEKGLETAKYWMLWPWLSWKYFFLHLILNNLSSPLDTQCLAAGKLAMYLHGHLGPTDVGAEGDGLGSTDRAYWEKSKNCTLHMKWGWEPPG